VVSPLPNSLPKEFKKKKNIVKKRDVTNNVNLDKNNTVVVVSYFGSEYPEAGDNTGEHTENIDKIDVDKEEYRSEEIGMRN
jgi:hypothetical protein